MAEEQEQIEAEARKQGWRPQDEWEGDPDQWKTAEKFLEDGKEINGILRKNFDKLNSEYANLRAEMSKRDELLTRVLRGQEEEKKAAVEKAIKELKAERRRAVQESDVDLVEDLDSQIEEHQKSLSEADKGQEDQGSNAPTQTFLAWQEQNKWYTDDPLMAMEANEIGAKLFQSEQARLGRTPDEQTILNAVTRKMSQLYPNSEYFRKPAKGEPESDPVEGDGRPSNSGRNGKQKKKGYNDLPADAKAACDRFVHRGDMDTETYVKYYFAGEQ